MPPEGVIASVMLAPWVTVTVDEAGVSVKVPPLAVITLTVITVEAVNAPEVPVTVTVEAPVGAVALAATVSTPPARLAVTPVPVAFAV